MPTDDQNGSIVLPTTSINFPLQIEVTFAEAIVDSAIGCEIEGEHFVALAACPVIEATAAFFEVIIVIDCSGSMSGSKIRTAQETLKIFLRSLQPGFYYNVIRFGSSFEAMYPESVEYTNENFQDSLEKADQMDADLGGTDLISPLAEIYSQKPRPGFVRQIFVITDGIVEDESGCLTLVTTNRESSRLFAVGIGQDVARKFIEELAKCSTGTPCFVLDSGDVSAAVLTQLSEGLKPAVVSSQIHLDSCEAIEVAPFPIPPLFSGVLTHVFVKAPFQAKLFL